MAKKRSRNRNRGREPGAESVAPAAAPVRERSRPPRPRRAGRGSSGRSRLWAFGVGALVVVGLVALIVNGARQSAGGDFELTAYQGDAELGGHEMAFSEVFDQGKPVVLNFWAGLCPPCRAEMPGFQRVYDQLGDDFILLGLDVGPFMNLGSNRDARALLDELNITYPTARAHNRSAVVQFGVFSMPTTVFFTPDRQIFRSWEGFLDQGRMTSFVQELIDVSKTAATSGEPPAAGSHG